jgi:hypothetical protein
MKRADVLIESAQSVAENPRRSAGCRTVGQRPINNWDFVEKLSGDRHPRRFAQPLGIQAILKRRTPTISD